MEELAMKGFNTGDGYMGLVDGKYILFASESEEFHKILFWCSDIAFILSNPDISTAVGKANSHAKFFLGEIIFLS